MVTQLSDPVPSTQNRPQATGSGRKGWDVGVRMTLLLDRAGRVTSATCARQGLHL